MPDPKIKVDSKKVDTKEFELPDTVFIRDIENRVFQGIVQHCVSDIEGVVLVGKTFIDNFLGLGGQDNLKAIFATQDQKNHSVNIKLEVNISYGTSIPQKADEIQTKIAEEITRLTGLHVASVHVVFKDVISEEFLKQAKSNTNTPSFTPPSSGDDYSDEF